MESVGPSEGPGSSRVIEFIDLSPPEFTRSEAGKDPKNFIDLPHMIFVFMHASKTEAVEFADFRLHDIVVLWYE